MFDTMTLTKTAGAFCGALLIFMLGNWAAESIYSMGGGHGEDHAQGYVIDTGEDEAAEEVADEAPDMAAIFASADASKGERVFNKCKACHVLEDGANGVGPHLYDVVGRDVGAVDGFGYSGALSEAADVWTAEELYAFLENPAGYAPGTSMGFAGLGKSEDRANVIAYLDQADGETDIAIEAAAEAPTEEAASEEAPAEEAATEEEAPAEETATEEEAPAEQAATEEEAPAGEAAAEEAPAEEAATEATESADAGGSEFAAMVASADAGNGERLYRRCQACHKLEDGANGVGPHLYGIVGRDIAGVDGFNYSDALSGVGGAWTLDQLSAWIENPRDFAPGNRMGFAGLKDEQDRADLMAYLQTIGN
ncbi:Cytochrome c2 [Roseovarius tolerans]|uniref:Cytochrome c2 n=1 Tax=Roseovarius tolerans TaxID=74031 RepID=A0A1H7WWP4_9RHOB|nr:cytochrome c family protein [Roseovarius tolerans]SEM25992.1 Cytochrome c2 [Roseovarius tolerans]